MKSTYEKPSEKKKRIKTENLKRIKKQQKLRNRYEFCSEEIYAARKSKMV